MFRKKTSMVIALIIAWILGAVVGGRLVAVPYSKQFRRQYYIGVLDQVNVLNHIYWGKTDQLAARIQGSLPQYVLAIDKVFKKDKRRLSALWAVQRFYTTNSLPVPENIIDILDALPPRPPTSCELRKMQSDKDKKADAEAILLENTE